VTSVTLGVFVGGAARRMNGLPKGLIAPSPGAAAPVARALAFAEALGLRALLVGEHGAYTQAFPDVRVLADDPAGIGPIGGLRALCRAARGGAVIALACDMPYVPATLLQRLASPGAPARALLPRGAGGFWEPLCAHYDADALLPALDAAVAAGEHSLQRLVARIGASELTLDAAERAALFDWDSPGDLPPSACTP
jgi:molybdenum cofactor guanylyltransferase